MSVLKPQFLVVACLTAALSNNALAGYGFGSPWGLEEEAERRQKQYEADMQAWDYTNLRQNASGDYSFPSAKECYVVKGEQDKNLMIFREVNPLKVAVEFPVEEFNRIVSDDIYENGVTDDKGETMKCIKADHYVATFNEAISELTEEAQKCQAQVLTRYIQNLQDEQRDVIGAPSLHDLKYSSTYMPSIEAPELECVPFLKKKSQGLVALMKGELGTRSDFITLPEHIIPWQIQTAKETLNFKPQRPDLF
ncbi:MAG: hypothetical protein H6867_09585 [Rhodospirillales bacterium]|nr:hypothetical protein [Rhodospirillales bacterium]MCB9995965.1 hypothetical protein [Rhodospirillales bacterium]